MTPPEITHEQADQHNAFTREGYALIKGELIIHESGLKRPPGFFLRRKLKRAIRLFENAIIINPNGWQSMWTIGKIYQRMGDQFVAYKWFSRAHSVNPTQTDVAREAGLAALDAGLIDDATRLCHAAVKLSPDDARAEECARVVVQQAPHDSIYKTELKLVRDVAGGEAEKAGETGGRFPRTVTQSQEV